MLITVEFLCTHRLCKASGFEEEEVLFLIPLRINHITGNLCGVVTLIYKKTHTRAKAFIFLTLSHNSVLFFVVVLTSYMGIYPALLHQFLSGLGSRGTQQKKHQFYT